ncbi:hypothetical protein Ae168Ps1_2676 [Pseudonocardia sp. Ae168_Ps1]|nr:hypothetical protein Ae168Ps1_2676 [Pseudonocardia sp. Ae168_Ps1]
MLTNRSPCDRGHFEVHDTSVTGCPPPSVTQVSEPDRRAVRRR